MKNGPKPLFGLGLTHVAFALLQCGPAFCHRGKKILLHGSSLKLVNFCPPSNNMIQFIKNADPTHIIDSESNKEVEKPLAPRKID